MLSDYWLCWVVQKYVSVKVDGGATVEGVHIRQGDGYALIQWMEHSEDEGVLLGWQLACIVVTCKACLQMVAESLSRRTFLWLSCLHQV